MAYGGFDCLAQEQKRCLEIDKVCMVLGVVHSLSFSSRPEIKDG
jgi:hypothetical protein